MYDEDILTLEDTMPFGKYRGWTVKDVLADDAGYLRWMLANTARGLETQVEDALENESLRHELIDDCY